MRTRSLVSLCVLCTATAAVFFDVGCGNGDDDSGTAPTNDAGSMTDATGTTTGDTGTTTGDTGTTTGTDGGGTKTSCTPVTTPKSTCAPGKVTFGVPVNLPWPTTANVDGLVAEDLNGDGKVDIISRASGGGGGVDVYLSKGDGTFAANVHYNADLISNGITAGDFDGDCIPDILATSASNNVLSFFKGKGDGTLAPESQIAGPQSALTMLARDLNADGKLDYVIQGGSAAMIGLGKGDGTFASAMVPFDIGGSTDMIDLGDFDGNGSPDLIVAMEVVDGTGSACFFPNAGNGTFGAEKCAALASGANANKAAAADYNGDGKLDIAVKTDQVDTASVFLGNGDGTFGTRADYALAGGQAMHAVDINNDGKPDLAAYDALTSSVNVLVNKGDGTFPATSMSLPNGGPTAEADEPMVIGSFTGSGLPGIAVNDRTLGTIDVIVATCAP